MSSNNDIINTVIGEHLRILTEQERTRHSFQLDEPPAQGCPSCAFGTGRRLSREQLLEAKLLMVVLERIAVSAMLN